MFRRSWSHAAIVALMASLTLAALTPLAAADHAYSHRYVVYGRVVDAENNPVPDLTVDLGYESPFKPDGPCGRQPGTDTDAFGETRTQPVTNEFGEFIFCFHIHGISRGTPGVGIISIPSNNVEHRFDFDGFMRYSFIPIKLDTAMPTANKEAPSTTYTVMGRAWEASKSEIKVETIGVYGDTLHNLPFEIDVEIDGKEKQTVNGTTNGYGDFAVRVPVDARPGGGTVTVRVDNHTFTAPIDGELGVTHVRGQVGELKTTPGAALFAIVGVLAVAALLARRE